LYEYIRHDYVHALNALRRFCIGLLQMQMDLLGRYRAGIGIHVEHLQDMACHLHGAIVADHLKTVAAIVDLHAQASLDVAQMRIELSA
jgi:hypothetical protein